MSIAVARSHLQRDLDAQLSGSAQSFRSGPGADARDARTLAIDTRRWLSEKPLPASQMAAVSIAGQRVLTSAGGIDLFEIGNPRSLLAASQVRWWSLHGSDGVVRGLTVPILAGSRQLGTLVLLAYERPIASTLSALLRGTIIASAVGLALALLLGLVIARRSLRPLTRMAAEVAAIEATGDLSRRISVGGRTDEVGRLASAFDRMLTRLEAAFVTQRRFLAESSHELRTPLTVARGQLELLAEELDAGRQASLAVVTDELDRMARLVEDLLLLARLDEGGELRQERVETELVLREAALRGMLLASRSVAVEAAADLHVLADPDRLLQVITNLVANAVQHTDESGHIVLSSGCQNGHAVLRVADDGAGIPDTELPYVFERFYRGGQAKSSNPGGAGLGLAIAASIVTAMEGTIDVRSSHLLGGTTFEVRLPVADGAAQ